MYHTSEKERAKKILAKKSFEGFQSIGSNHWLGDGVYLYDNYFYAFRWIYIMDGSKVLPSQVEGFSVLKVDWNCDKDRIFDLDNPEFQQVFMRVGEKLLKDRDWKKKTNKYQYADGLILNVMFKNIPDYKENYDVVKRTFSTYDAKKPNFSTRMKEIQEYQCCIKNCNIITEIEDITSYVMDKEDDSKILDFNKYKGASRYLDENTYSTTNGGYRT